MTKATTSRRAVLGGMLAGTVAPASVTKAAATSGPASPGFAHAVANPKSSLARGTDIEIAFEGDRCIHARYCVAWLPDVFRPGQEPWMDPDANSADEIAAVVRNCPSGALQYHRLDGIAQETSPTANSVKVSENGPLAVRAELVLDGTSIGNRATLCRCGRTRSTPFCDGSHAATGFEATGEPPSREDPENKNYFAFLEGPTGPLRVTVEPDGPYDVEGPLQIQSGTGRKIDVAQQVRLCRCGRSADKPFCDGSHADKT